MGCFAMLAGVRTLDLARRTKAAIIGPNGRIRERDEMAEER
jgi:hypothetical protein